MIDGGLFTRDFLLEGIRETEMWRALDMARLAALRAIAGPALHGLSTRKNPNEAETEEDCVYPLLEALGWHHKDVQPNASVKAREDVPDALLFPDADAKSAAGRIEPWKRFQHGLCVVEAKRWERALDREEAGRRAEPGTPSSQMLRYLRRVDDVTKGKLRWGILTNGRVWRLYFQGALSVAEDFLEIDLGKVFDLPSCGIDLLDKRPDGFADDAAWRDHGLRLFLLLFGREAFLPSEAGETFHMLARREGMRWEAKVARTLSDTVFDTVFPTLADALARADSERLETLSATYLDEVRQGALILLYRLLFVLYAEDRNLLPDEGGPYAPYCLTRMRFEIADNLGAGGTFPPDFVTFWPRLAAIFRAIAVGNDHLGIPPYNGGLFDPAAAPILRRVAIPDSVMAQVVYGLSHQPDAGDGRGPRYINYRDLSVQQLGSVYERILEFSLRATPAGTVEIDADDAARHKSGSYYTPEELVSLIIQRAVGPLVAERVAAFAAMAQTLASDRRPVAERLAALAAYDPATKFLSLKICDPAMGSGHFLVSLVDWLADETLAAMAEAPALVAWGDYVSPLAARIAAVREKIAGEARTHRWPIVEGQLDDRHVVRRMVLKRVVYGIDKNPMAVELAKVALWLHSFTVGAPLSFLDHHLRAGDSVVGAWVRPTVDALQKRGALFNLGQIARVEQVAGLMAEIEETTDNDVAEVAASKAKFGTVADATKPVEAFFSLITADLMMGVIEAAPRKAPPPPEKMAGKSQAQLKRWHEDVRAFESASALQLVFEGTYGDPIKIAAGTIDLMPSADDLARSSVDERNVPLSDDQLAFPGLSFDLRSRVLADRLVGEARALAAHHRFFHWEVGFPNVWSNLASAEPEGGFDAVIGNPPYVRQELLGDGVKRALRAGYAAFDGMADLYVYFYEQGLRLLKPGGRMSYVVTNKWLKAGYAEGLRDLFARQGWLEFVADFGHAKHFFPDADVFPSVIVVRKPDRAMPAPTEADICVIPRDAVPRKGLGGVVTEATFPLPRAMFTKAAWVLEPKPVMDLLEKIRRNGVPLAEYAGVKPFYGIKTGLNEAFLIDTDKRNELVRADPACAEIIKPYLRGQDIERWWSLESGLFMIVLKSSGNHPWPWSAAVNESQAEIIFRRIYPSLHNHMKGYETWIEPNSGRPAGLRHREDQGRYWWELRSCDYYDLFLSPKLSYQVIQFYPKYFIDEFGNFGNDKTFFLPTNDKLLLCILNSPIMWWFNWRNLPHMKDEALSTMTYKMEQLPVSLLINGAADSVRINVNRTIDLTLSIRGDSKVILDWLRHEFGLDKPGQALAQPHTLDADAFVAAIRKALPRSKQLSAAEIGRLKREHAETVEPVRRAADEVRALERTLSDLVNAAYGLTPEDVALMWATAPPRMPLLGPASGLPKVFTTVPASGRPD